MTRKQAVAAAVKALEPYGYRSMATADALVDVLGALNVIKLERPDESAAEVLSNFVIRPTKDGPPETGWMIGPWGASCIVERLKAAGFKIEPA
jgi:hypothetical protein